MNNAMSDSITPGQPRMPFVWTHAEFFKLLRSLKDNAVWDTPLQTVQRYLKSGRQGG